MILLLFLNDIKGIELKLIEVLIMFLPFY
uniref:Uncharacterized protein n=1 Tax=Tetranychus urticae TaxID=32264 RepID=T1JQD4_TETUR